MLVPADRARAAHAVLADDYATPLADGSARSENDPFEALMERCVVIGERANGLKA